MHGFDTASWLGIRHPDWWRARIFICVSCWNRKFITAQWLTDNTLWFIFFLLSVFILRPPVSTRGIASLYKWQKHPHFHPGQCCVGPMCSVSKQISSRFSYISLIARFMGPTWGPPGADRTQVDPMLAPWILLFGIWPYICFVPKVLAKQHFNGHILWRVHGLW